MTDKAKDAYELFLDRRFTDRNVSMSLAHIYFNEERRNCRKIEGVLRGLDTIPEAAHMLSECGIRVRVIDASETVQKTKLSPVMLTLRISGAAVFAGALTTGLIINGVTIPNLADKYNDHAERGDPPSGTDAESYAKVQQMRKDIDSNILLRNTMYVLAGVGLGGFAVTFFF
jgi:hypothetical protein